MPVPPELVVFAINAVVRHQRQFLGSRFAKNSGMGAVTEAILKTLAQEAAKNPGRLFMIIEDNGTAVTPEKEFAKRGQMVYVNHRFRRL